MGNGMVESAITISNTVYAPARLGNQQLRDALADSAARLASGNRILQIADDVRAVTQASALQTQTAGFNQSASNAAEGYSLLQTAAGGLDQISEVIDHLQSLAEQAADSSLTDEQRAFLQQQFSESINEIDTITGHTTFNGLSPLSGFTADFRIGPQPGDSIHVAIGSVTSAALFGGTLPDIGSIANATAAQDAITDASNILQGVTDYVAGVQQGFAAAAAALAQTGGGSQRATGHLVDTDIDAELNQRQSKAILLNSSTALLAQASRLEPQLLRLLHSASIAASPQTGAQIDSSDDTPDNRSTVPAVAASSPDGPAQSAAGSAAGNS